MSSSLRKMRLVGEAELDRLKAKQLREYDPELQVLVRLQSEIDGILDDPQTSPSEKLTRLRNAQHRFRGLSQKEAREQGYVLDSKPKPTEEPEPAPEPAAPIPETPISGQLVQAIENLPKQYRNKATKFLNWLHDHKDSLKFDPRSGRLVIKGTEIPGSNVHDLIYNLYVKRTGPSPSGSQEFVSSLSKLDVPQTLISNRAVHALHPPKKVPKARAIMNEFPGQRPNILKVYDV